MPKLGVLEHRVIFRLDEEEELFTHESHPPFFVRAIRVSGIQAVKEVGRGPHVNNGCETFAVPECDLRHGFIIVDIFFFVVGTVVIRS